MDLKGIPKLQWRAGIIEAYKSCSGKTKLPFNRYFFTLGGPCTEPGSEFDYFHCQRDFCQPRQYVSVERDRRIHSANSRIKGPTWRHGDFGIEFYNWYRDMDSDNDQEAGIVNFDSMCGMDTALDSIELIMSALKDWRQVKGPDCLLVVNVVKRMRWRENQGNQFPDPVSTFRHSHMRAYWKNLIDCHEYHNKTIGKGARVSTLQTMMFWI